MLSAIKAFFTSAVDFITSFFSSETVSEVVDATEGTDDPGLLEVILGYIMVPVNFVISFFKSFKEETVSDNVPEASETA